MFSEAQHTMTGHLELIQATRQANKIENTKWQYYLCVLGYLTLLYFWSSVSGEPPGLLSLPAPLPEADLEQTNEARSALKRSVSMMFE